MAIASAYRPFRPAVPTLAMRNQANGAYGRTSPSASSYYRPLANTSLVSGPAMNFTVKTPATTGPPMAQTIAKATPPPNMTQMLANLQQPTTPYTFESLLGGLKIPTTTGSPGAAPSVGGVPGGGGGGGAPGNTAGVTAAYAAIIAQANKDIAMARAAALDNERQTLLGFGSQELARAVLGSNDPTLKAISDDPDKSTSTLGQLNYASRKNEYSFNEAENSGNLFYSGARASGLSQLAHQKVTDIATATRGTQSQITQIKQALQQAEAAYQERILEAQLAMAQFEYANGGSGSGGGDGPAPPPPSGNPPPPGGSPSSTNYAAVLHNLLVGGDSNPHAGQTLRNTINYG